MHVGKVRPKAGHHPSLNMQVKLGSNFASLASHIRFHLLDYFSLFCLLCEFTKM